MMPPVWLLEQFLNRLNRPIPCVIASEAKQSRSHTQRPWFAAHGLPRRFAARNDKSGDLLQLDHKLL